MFAEKLFLVTMIMGGRAAMFDTLPFINAPPPPQFMHPITGCCPCTDSNIKFPYNPPPPSFPGPNYFMENRFSLGPVPMPPPSISQPWQQVTMQQPWWAFQPQSLQWPPMSQFNQMNQPSMSSPLPPPLFTNPGFSPPLNQPWAIQWPSSSPPPPMNQQFQWQQLQHSFQPKNREALNRVEHLMYAISAIESAQVDYRYLTKDTEITVILLEEDGMPVTLNGALSILKTLKGLHEELLDEVNQTHPREFVLRIKEKCKLIDRLIKEHELNEEEEEEEIQKMMASKAALPVTKKLVVHRVAQGKEKHEESDSENEMDQEHTRKKAKHRKKARTFSKDTLEDDEEHQSQLRIPRTLKIDDNKGTRYVPTQREPTRSRIVYGENRGNDVPKRKKDFHFRKSLTPIDGAVVKKKKRFVSWTDPNGPVPMDPNPPPAPPMTTITKPYRESISLDPNAPAPPELYPPPAPPLSLDPKRVIVLQEQPETKALQPAAIKRLPLRATGTFGKQEEFEDEPDQQQQQVTLSFTPTNPF